MSSSRTASAASTPGATPSRAALQTSCACAVTRCTSTILRLTRANSQARTVSIATFLSPALPCPSLQVRASDSTASIAVSGHLCRSVPARDEDKQPGSIDCNGNKHGGRVSEGIRGAAAVVFARDMARRVRFCPSAALTLSKSAKSLRYNFLAPVCRTCLFTSSQVDTVLDLREIESASPFEFITQTFAVFRVEVACEARSNDARDAKRMVQGRAGGAESACMAMREACGAEMRVG